MSVCENCIDLGVLSCWGVERCRDCGNVRYNPLLENLLDDDYIDPYEDEPPSRSSGYVIRGFNRGRAVGGEL